MSEYGIVITPGDAVMDWGCATGRVLRGFVKEAQFADFWGVDQHVPSIMWAKVNLSPPFHFVTCTSYPHLPFEDHRFKLIYAFSVFTHMEYLSDMWLMELNRIVAKGGYVIVTVHDEHTVKVLQEKRPAWVPQELDLTALLEHEISIVSGPGWNVSFTFFHSEWVRKEYGRYFDVVAIRPHTEGYQSAVVLHKA
jgi:ubiquinone/menaquinone biosynthesis C-methylase UbiE